MADPRDENLKSSKDSGGEEDERNISSDEDKETLTSKDEDEQKLSSDEDKVAAAYENISKKLESIRNGKTPEDDDGPGDGKKDEDGDEEGLDEWKGPKPPSTEEADGDDDEESVELRKVKLKNLENSDETEDELDKESDDVEDEEAVIKKDRDDEGEAKKEWKPEEDDPLDEDDSKSDEEEDEDEKAEGDDEEADEAKSEDEIEAPSKRKEIEENNDEYEIPARKPLDEDLSSNESEVELQTERAPQPDTLDDLAEDDYSIPNLKGSRQVGSNIGYNAPSETDTFERGNHNKSNMENNDPNIFFSSHNQPAPPKRANKFHLLILVIIGVVVIGFTVYILKGGFGELGNTIKPSPSPSVESTPTPTPTPTPEPERSKYKVRVLNGSGKTGLAKTVSEKLKELGYQIEKTGNATNSAFEQTLIRVKSSEESFIPQIVKDLTPDYDAAGNASLDDDDSAEIEVIIGAK